MYQQFKRLANVDMTTTPMEVGPTMHHIMGGVGVAWTGLTGPPAGAPSGKDQGRPCDRPYVL